MREKDKQHIFYILAPAGGESGGPELAHQMCATLMSLGCEAYMYYADGKRIEPVDVEAPPRYRKYGTTHIASWEAVNDPYAVFIFNEGMTPYISVIHSGKKVLWWMSVDNYTNSTGEIESIEKITEEIDIHLVQSAYARNYLLEKVKIPDNRILYVSDYIGEDFGKFIMPPQYRQNIALYNPYKGYADLKPLIDQVTWIRWIPIYNLTEEEVIILMQTAKIYIDFGNHPGKDRIPREAASCGCCIITNKKGSAAFFEDVPIPDMYKFSDVSTQYNAIESLMREICENYEQHLFNFIEYREFIKREKVQFTKAVEQFVRLVAHYDFE